MGGAALLRACACVLTPARSAIGLGQSTFWGLYFDRAVFSPADWTPSHEFISNAGTMFLASYAALTHAAGPCRSTHLCVWSAFTVFTLYYMSYPRAFFQVANLLSCVLVMGSLIVGKTK